MELNRLDLNKLHVFLSVVEKGGVSAAAATLSLTRSAVSQSVSTLERDLGFALFDRVGRKLVLTVEGRELHDEFLRYHRRLETVLDGVRGKGVEPRGLLRLGLFVGFPRERLAQVLSGFLQKHPAVQVKVVFAATGELLRLLLQDRIDLALTIHRLAGREPRVRSEELFREDLILVAGGKLRGISLRSTELSTVPVVEYYQTGELFRPWVRHHFGKVPRTVNVRAYAAEAELVLELVMKGVGVGVLPESLAKPYLAKGRLRALGGSRAEMAGRIWLNERELAGAGRLRKAFRDFLRESE
jgi:DNA-binding transcriptional LysR family regulator